MNYIIMKPTYFLFFYFFVAATPFLLTKEQKVYQKIQMLDNSFYNITKNGEVIYIGPVEGYEVEDEFHLFIFHPNQLYYLNAEKRGNMMINNSTKSDVIVINILSDLTGVIYGDLSALEHEHLIEDEIKNLCKQFQYNFLQYKENCNNLDDVELSNIYNVYEIAMLNILNVFTTKTTSRTDHE
uniref:Uncharacterized protein LOC114343336 n=1 Tax=Diabrotica virgifera virgifera TaxID=50390 RepID=A0A6P7GX09_DIAVI